MGRKKQVNTTRQLQNCRPGASVKGAPKRKKGEQGLEKTAKTGGTETLLRDADGNNELRIREGGLCIETRRDRGGMGLTRVSKLVQKDPGKINPLRSWAIDEVQKRGKMIRRFDIGGGRTGGRSGGSQQSPGVRHKTAKWA